MRGWVRELHLEPSLCLSTAKDWQQQICDSMNAATSGLAV